jgi:hypothetical protein
LYVNNSTITYLLVKQTLVDGLQKYKTTGWVGCGLTGALGLRGGIEVGGALGGEPEGAIGQLTVENWPSQRTIRN